MLGVGLVEVPPVPYRDPASAVLANPEVAEHKRFCSQCGEPVGRSRDGRPGRTEGYCPRDGSRFSFDPKLDPGDLVAGQYEVLGCIAHGGLGWIYLAQDRNVSDRWVVLKGLLDTGDAEALAAAEKERAFLAEIEHPDIVKIYNFVQHPDPDTGDPMSYIVMEYVGGKAVKDMLADIRDSDANASLPIEQAVAYVLEVLRAFGYLHERGLLYCDFKPDNVIHSREQIKLIDLGAVIRMDDYDSAIYGTVGYQAPEIAEKGPSVSSDLYTIGRSLAVMTFPFRGYTSTYATELPAREEISLLVTHESFDRLLRRATHGDPEQRFHSAAEMADQLTGVLREVLSTKTPDAPHHPAPSTLFGPEQSTAGPGQDPHATSAPALAPLTPAAALAALPIPLMQSGDPGAGFLAGLTIEDPDDLITALDRASVRSVEVLLLLTRTQIRRGDADAAGKVLDELDERYPGEWRTHWYRGVAALEAQQVADAWQIFDAIYGLLPGEIAPRLALAFCCELYGDAATAGRYYTSIWRTDPAYVSAAFGSARVLMGAGDRDGALAVLDSVPETSSYRVPAQISAVAMAVRGCDPDELAAPDLTAAAERLERLQLDAERNAWLAAEVLEAAVTRVGSAGAAPAAGPPSLLGVPFTDEQLRRKLEHTYRTLARLSHIREDRHLLVDRANAVRPRTLV